MKKSIILFVLIFQIIVSFAQIKLETTTVYNITVIKPTLYNVTVLAQAGFSEFRTAMQDNGYKLTTDGKGYCAASAKFTYMVQKSTGSMIWTFDDDQYNLISGLRMQIKSKDAAIRPTYEQGFEIYRLKMTDGTKIKIAIQEENEGFAGISVTLF